MALTSSRLSEADRELPISLEPPPSKVTLTCSGASSASSRSLAIRHCSINCDKSAADKRLFVADQPAFGQMRQGQVDIIAAQHQMIADADTGQFRLLFAVFDLDQRQVGRAAADIADQQQMDIGQRLSDRAGMAP